MCNQAAYGGEGGAQRSGSCLWPPCKVFNICHSLVRKSSLVPTGRYHCCPERKQQDGKEGLLPLQACHSCSRQSETVVLQSLGRVSDESTTSPADAPAPGGRWTAGREQASARLPPAISKWQAGMDCGYGTLPTTRTVQLLYRTGLAGRYDEEHDLDIRWIRFSLRFAVAVPSSSIYK